MKHALTALTPALVVFLLLVGACSDDDAENGDDVADEDGEKSSAERDEDGGNGEEVADEDDEIDDGYVRISRSHTLESDDGAAVIQFWSFSLRGSEYMRLEREDEPELDGAYSAVYALDSRGDPELREPVDVTIEVEQDPDGAPVRVAAYEDGEIRPVPGSELSDDGEAVTGRVFTLAPAYVAAATPVEIDIESAPEVVTEGSALDIGFSCAGDRNCEFTCALAHADEEADVEHGRSSCEDGYALEEIAPAGTYQLSIWGRDENGHYGARRLTFHVQAPDDSSAIELWQAEYEHSGRAPVVGEDGSIYMAGRDGGAYRFDDDGEIAWHVDDLGDYAGFPTLSGDTLYVAADGDLYALNVEDGSPKWVFEDADSLTSNPAVTAGGAIYIVGDRGVYKIGESGDKVWHFSPEEDMSFNWNLAVDSGQIYVPAGGEFHAIDADEGELLWSVSGPGATRKGSPAIADDGTIYVRSMGGDELLALDPEDGSTVWSHEAEGIGGAPVVGEDGIIYIVNSHVGSNAHLRAIDPDGPEELWASELRYSGTLSAPAAADNGVVYVTHSAAIFGISAEDGEKLWEESDRPGYRFPVVGPGGRLYSATNAALHAFHIGASGPADGSWPIYGGGPGRPGSTE